MAGRALVTLMLAGCATRAPFRVDHVILGVSDLDAGVRELEARTGLHAQPGGVHPGAGTHNALISLGPTTYLEILGPTADAKPAEVADLVPLSHLTPVGFAMFAPDIEASRRELARRGMRTTTPTAGSRVTPDGVTLRFSTFEIVEPAAGDLSPFFIHWDDLAAHPAKTSPKGCTLVSLELRGPGKVQQLALASIVHARTGAPALAITLRCGAQTVRFP